MTSQPPLVTLSPRDYDAVVFDLDGVLTATATVHAAAWKQLFDPLLAQRAADAGEAVVAFDLEADYRRYVDGKSREDGVVAFLASRGITVPAGTAEDPLDAHTVSALGRLKDQYFLHHLAHHGVDPADAACAFVRTLRAHAVKTAVVSSSTHCADVLVAAGLASLFDAQVDGRDFTRLALQGKPAPDALLEAAQRLQVDPARMVVVEDAIAGVTAGRAGRFGYIIGVDGGGQAQGLQEAGADVVVTSLAQVQVAVEPPSAWALVFDGFEPAQEGIREALCALGNGYVTTRAAVPGPLPMRCTIPGRTSPGATTGCAPRLPARRSRTRISSIGPTGSRSAFASPTATGSTSAPLRFGLIVRNSISKAACWSAPSALRTPRGGGPHSRNVAWSRCATCTWARWS